MKAAGQETLVVNVGHPPAVAEVAAEEALCGDFPVALEVIHHLLTPELRIAHLL